MKIESFVKCGYTGWYYVILFAVKIRSIWLLKLLKHKNSLWVKMTGGKKEYFINLEHITEWKF